MRPRGCEVTIRKTRVWLSGGRPHWEASGLRGCATPFLRFLDLSSRLQRSVNAQMRCWTEVSAELKKICSRYFSAEKSSKSFLFFFNLKIISQKTKQNIERPLRLHLTCFCSFISHFQASEECQMSTLSICFSFLTKAMYSFVYIFWQNHISKTFMAKNVSALWKPRAALLGSSDSATKFKKEY